MAVVNYTFRIEKWLHLFGFENDVKNRFYLENHFIM